MKTKVLQVFYGADALPYKDKERTVHFPIVGNAIQNANNTTQIKFYFDRLIEENEQTTFVAVSKLPNGKIGSKILETYDDEELGEQYALLDLDSFYTQYKGDVFISLQGYQGGVRVEQDEQGIYQIYGTPVIAATGSIKLAINYAPSFVGSGETENVTLQQVLGELSTKLGVRQETLHVEELPTVGNPDIWYVVNDDPNDPNKQNIYIWNATTQSYVWVGDNTLDLGDYYTKEQGETFEGNVNETLGDYGDRIESVENELSSVASGSPKGVYATLSDLETAFPDGDDGIYVVSADGHWYYWNGSAWTDGGVYLSAPFDNELDNSSINAVQNKVVTKSLSSQQSYKKESFVEYGYLPYSVEFFIKSIKYSNSFPITISAYTNLYGGTMNTIYDIPVTKTGTNFIVYTEDGSNFPASKIRFLDSNNNLLDYSTLTGTNFKIIKAVTSADIYAIQIQANYPTNQKIMVAFGEIKYGYQEYEQIQTITLNSASDITSLKTFNGGTYIKISDNKTCEIEYAYDVTSDIKLVENNVFDIEETNLIVENPTKNTFESIEITDTDETDVELILFTNLFEYGLGQTVLPSGILKNGSKISISTEDCSPFLYTKITFLNNLGVEMDYFTLTGYGFKREGLTLNITDDVWAIKLYWTDSAAQNQKIQVSLGESALDYRDYVRPQKCSVKVSDNNGWEGLRIIANKMYIYSPSSCTIKAKYYINKKRPKSELDGLKYVACGDSFTAGGFSVSNSPVTTGSYDYDSKLYKTYPFWISKRTGMKLINMGHAGDTMADFMNRYQNIPVDADYVTIAYGLNDYSQGIQIGTINDTQEDATFMGYWNTALTWILEHLPFAHIGVIIMPAYMGNEYREATENICKKYGIPCLNLYTNPNAPLFMNKKDADATVEESRYAVMEVSQTDGHPNWKAHRFISTCIEGWIKSI